MRQMKKVLPVFAVAVVVVWCTALMVAQTPYTLQVGPVVQNLTPSSAQIWWHADQTAASPVKYGLSPSTLDQTASSQGGSADHTAQLSGLQPGKTYYYTVMKPDNSPAAQAQFTTPQQEQANSVRIINGPVIESVGPNQAVLAWSTTAPASTIVKYGTDLNSLNKTAQAPWGSTTHRVDLKNLQPNTQYFFQVLSSQAKGTGTTAQGGEGQFRTVNQGQQALVLSGPAH